MVAGREQRLARLEREPRAGRRLGELARQHGRRQALERLVGRVEHDQLRQHSRDEARERRAERLARAVAGAHELERLVAPEPGRERARELVDQPRHGVVEADVPGREPDRLVAGAVAQRAEGASGVDDRRRAHLGEVVVVRGYPEHRHHGRAALGLETLGDDDRRERLPEHEQRAAEEPGLLARDHGGGARLAEGARPLGGAARAASGLLAPQRLRHLHDRAPGGQWPLGRAGDRGQLEARRGQERGGALRASQVVEEERAQRLLERFVGDDIDRVAHLVSRLDWPPGHGPEPAG